MNHEPLKAARIEARQTSREREPYAAADPVRPKAPPTCPQVRRAAVRRLTCVAGRSARIDGHDAFTTLEAAIDPAPIERFRVGRCGIGEMLQKRASPIESLQQQ